MTASTRSVLQILTLAALLGGVFFGLKPVTSYEIVPSALGEEVDCGSAWVPAEETLTTFGKASCAEEGVDSNRTTSFILLGLSAVLLGGAMLSPKPNGQDSTKATVGPSAEQQLVQCPYCAEAIRPEARVCRFCNRETSWAVASYPPQPPRV